MDGLEAEVGSLNERLPRVRARVDRLTGRLSRLEGRVQELELELHDARSQGRRVAEISDLVTELLVNEASRRDPEFRRILDKYLDA